MPSPMRTIATALLAGAAAIALPGLGLAQSSMSKTSSDAGPSSSTLLKSQTDSSNWICRPAATAVTARFKKMKLRRPTSTR